VTPGGTVSITNDYCLVGVSSFRKKSYYAEDVGRSKREAERLRNGALRGPIEGGSIVEEKGTEERHAKRENLSRGGRLKGGFVLYSREKDSKVLKCSSEREQTAHP